MYEEELPCCGKLKIKYQIHLTITSQEDLLMGMDGFSFCPFCGKRISLSNEWREENI